MVVHTWPTRNLTVSWTIGSLIFLLALLAGRNFYYAYFYFYIVGAISLINSRSKFALINGTGITLFIGPFFKRISIKILWDEIEEAKLYNKTKTEVAVSGGRDFIPVKVDVSVEGLMIKLKEPLQDTIGRDIERVNRLTFFHDGVEVNDDYKEILILNEPELGLENLLDDMRPHIRVSGQEGAEYRKKKSRIFFVLNGILFFSAIVLYGITLFG